jgi:hypothetical protein
MAREAVTAGDRSPQTDPRHEAKTTGDDRAVGVPARGPSGSMWAGELRRAVAARTAPSNRAVARAVLAREAEQVDLRKVALKAESQAGAGWNGAAHRLAWGLIHRYCSDKASSLSGSRYVPDGTGVRLEGTTIVIGDGAIGRAAHGDLDALGAEMLAALTRAPATRTPEAELGAYFRAEIIKWLEKFAAAPSVEGAKTGFDELLGRGGPESTRKSFNNYTTCNDTTIQIFAKAAALVNKKVGYKLPKKAEFKYIGVVRRASDFGAPEIAKQAGAWVDASGGRPEKGDLVLFVNKKGGTYPEHIGFYYGNATTKSDPKAKPPPDPAGADVWLTIDGGQGTKGKWDAALKDATDNPQGYVAGSAKESILKRERWHQKDGLIEGEPNQPGGYKKVLGWVKVDKLIDPARIPKT